jgi:hypothetical protein
MFESMAPLLRDDTTDYGFHRIIKEYAGFPQFLALPCHFEHGWTMSPVPLATDLASEKPLMLVYNERRRELWRQHSDIPAFVVGDPLVRYRRLRKIRQADDAAGTIALPDHSTSRVEVRYNVESYCAALHGLPVTYQPVRVCLHETDVRNGMDVLYRRNGLEPVTAGKRSDEGFARSFLAIIRRSRYATSNGIGTYILACVDMGIPFFFLGEEPENDNFGGDPNEPRRHRKSELPLAREVLRLFPHGSVDGITAEQADFVRAESGLNACIGGVELRRMLWREVWHWALPKSARRLRLALRKRMAAKMPSS